MHTDLGRQRGDGAAALAVTALMGPRDKPEDDGLILAPSPPLYRPVPAGGSSRSQPVIE